MFEIKSEHEHIDLDCHPRREVDNQFDKVDLVPVETSAMKPKPRKIRIKSLPGQDPKQFYIADSLIPSLEESISLLPAIDFEVISMRRKDLQLFVYTSLVEDGKDYLTRLFKTDKNNQVYVHQMIAETVSKCNDVIIDEILQGEHEVHRIARPTKDDIFNGGGRTTEAAIRIRESMLKAKLSDLKADINTSNMSISPGNPSSFLNLNSADLYSEDSVKTQRAKQFVKRIQQQQEEKRKERELKEEFKRQKKLEEEAQKKEMEDRLKQEKKEFLIKEFQRKRQEKMKERKQQQAKSVQFKAFLEEFKNKTPLFKQKQKQFFQKFVIPQNNKKIEILKEIREDRKPLSHQQLKQHQKQYLEIREDHIYEKNAAKAVEQKTKKPQKIYYKSKFHSLIEKQEKQKEEIVDQSEIRAKMYTKRLEYASEIKTKFIPKIDAKKKQEMAKKIEELSWIEKVRAHQSLNIDSYKKDGKDNLDKLHKYIGQLKAKGKIRSDSSRTVESSPQAHKARYKNYLHELRESGTSSSQVKSSRTHHTIDYGSLLSSSEDAERFKYDLKKKEEVTSRREQYVANLGSRNLEKYMEEKKKLDEDYLESVKAKMAIINKFQ